MFLGRLKTFGCSICAGTFAAKCWCLVQGREFHRSLLWAVCFSNTFQSRRRNVVHLQLLLCKKKKKKSQYVTIFFCGLMLNWPKQFIIMIIKEILYQVCDVICLLTCAKTQPSNTQQHLFLFPPKIWLDWTKPNSGGSVFPTNTHIRQRVQPNTVNSNTHFWQIIKVYSGLTS